MTTSAARPLLEVRGATKRFGSNTVLDAVDFIIRPGEVRALVGENGAGKSTLIKSLTGTHSLDAGSVVFDGIERRFSRPRDALSLGIGVVPQERLVVPRLSAAENVLLTRQARRGPFIDHRATVKAAAKWLDRVGFALDPSTPAGELTVAQQQLLEIARGLSLEARLLFLDEPTASLTETEATALLATLRRLREEGVALVYVSHKLSEVYQIADSATVLRDGRATLQTDDLSAIARSELVTAMVGRDVVASDRYLPELSAPGESVPRLELDGVETVYGHQPITFSVRAGEIFGLYGIVGSGRSELAGALIGKARITGGSVRIDGASARPSDPSRALRRFGIGYVSEDRKGEGLVLEETVSDNITMTVLDQVSFGGVWLRPGRALEVARSAAERVGLAPSRVRSRTGDLSGGNQQKVSVAKWVAAGVKVIIIDEPTVGVDIAAKEDIYDVIQTIAADGAAVLLISSELEEIVRLSHRVGVMVDGDLRAVLDNTRSYADMSPIIMHEVIREPAGLQSAPGSNQDERN